MGLTACFLPKPVVGVNGSGMHTNVSVSKNGKNLFWDPKGEEKLSKLGWDFVDRILTHGNDLCLVLNSSVNAYRRLDPHFEAPNQLKASAVDRGSMIRIPIGNERSMRIEVRAVAPDANPYLVMYSIFKTGLEGDTAKIKNLRQAERYLPDNIYTAIDDFRKAEWTTKLLGEDVKARYADLKQASADRCPRLLGSFVKAAGSAVPPRGLQPVPVESVLTCCSSANRAPRGYSGAFVFSLFSPAEFAPHSHRARLPASVRPQIVCGTRRHTYRTACPGGRAAIHPEFAERISMN